GTLGFIVEARIQLTSPPPPLQVLVMGVSGLDAVMKIFAEFKTRTSLVAFEMFSEKALEKVLLNTDLPPPLETKTPFYVLAEVESESEQQQEIIMGVFEKCLEEGW